MNAATVALMAKVMWVAIIPGAIGFLLLDYNKHPIKVGIRNMFQSGDVMTFDKGQIVKKKDGSVESIKLTKNKVNLPPQVFNHAVPTKGIFGNMRYFLSLVSPSPGTFHPTIFDKSNFHIHPTYMEARNWFTTVVKTDIMKKLQKNQLPVQAFALGGIIIILVMGMIYQKTVMAAMADRAAELGLAITRSEGALESFSKALSSQSGGAPPAG